MEALCRMDAGEGKEERGHTRADLDDTGPPTPARATDASGLFLEPPQSAHVPSASNVTPSEPFVTSQKSDETIRNAQGEPA